MPCEVCEIPVEDEVLLLCSTDYWKAYLSYNQSYLGRCFIALKRHAGSLSDLTSEEWIDLGAMTAKVEAAGRSAFGATLFNWACLMNSAYQAAEPLPHVHWHVRPRYSVPVEFMGIRFEDPSFGHHYRNGEHRADVPEEVRRQIAQRIRNHMTP